MHSYLVSQVYIDHILNPNTSKVQHGKRPSTSILPAQLFAAPTSSNLDSPNTVITREAVHSLQLFVSSWGENVLGVLLECFRQVREDREVGHFLCDRLRSVDLVNTVAGGKSRPRHSLMSLDKGVESKILFVAAYVSAFTHVVISSDH